MAPPGEVGVLRRRPRNPSTAQCAPPTARPGVLKGRSFRCMVAAGLAEAAVPGDSPATGLPCCVMRPGLARQPAARSAAVISLQCACLARRHSFDSSVASYTAPHKSVHPAPRFGAPSSLGRCAAGRRPASVPSLRLSLHLQLALRRRIVPGGPASEGIVRPVSWLGPPVLVRTSVPQLLGFSELSYHRHPASRGPEDLTPCFAVPTSCAQGTAPG